MAPLSALPDEIVLKIFSYFSNQPDCLLNSITPVSKHWRDLSRDASIWKEFRVPRHWDTSNFCSFVKIKSISHRIQHVDFSEFTPSLDNNGTFFLEALAKRRLVAPNVTKLTFIRFESGKSRKGATAAAIIKIFPSLKFIMLKQHSGLIEELEFLSKKIPTLRAEIREVKTVSTIQEIVPILLRFSLWCTSLPASLCSDSSKKAEFLLSCCSELTDDGNFTFKFLDFLRDFRNQVTSINLTLDWTACADAIPRFFHQIATTRAMPNLSHLRLTSYSTANTTLGSYFKTPLPTTNIQQLCISLNKLQLIDLQTIFDACPNCGELEIFSNSGGIHDENPFKFKLPTNLDSIVISGCQLETLQRLLEASLDCHHLRRVEAHGEAIHDFEFFCLDMVKQSKKGWLMVDELFLSGGNCNGVSSILTYVMFAACPIKSIRFYDSNIQHFERLQKFQFSYKFPLLEELRLTYQYRFIPFPGMIEREIDRTLKHLSAESKRVRFVCVSVNYEGSLLLDLTFLLLTLYSLPYLETFTFMKMQPRPSLSSFPYCPSPAIREPASLATSLRAIHGKWIRNLSASGSRLTFTQCPLAYRF